MISHSICQEGIGFPYLSPTCYWYIAAGEDVAIQHASINDIPLAAAHVVKEVGDAADGEQLESIFRSDSCQDILLQYCGIGMQLSESTKDVICHEIIAYHSIGHVSKLLDQLSSGLQTLGVLKSFPEIFMPLFVFTGNISPADVLQAVFVEKKLSENETKMMAFLNTFIEEVSPEELKRFLIHCTGSFKKPLPRSILVDFSESDAVMAHTCDQSLIILFRQSNFQ